jgi:acetyl-CoA decarbonylase/synthase complex subunit epsilon
MAMTEPWQKAEIAGPKKALWIRKPEVVVAMVKRAKRPILIVGHEALDVELGEEKAIDLLIRIAKAAELPIVATGHIVGEFLKRDFQPAAWLPAVDIGNRLKDPDWKGFDGNGAYDLALFYGIPYYMEWLILNGLKHFASHLTTLSLDRFYQPNASWSFGNMKLEEWHKYLKVIETKFEDK